MARTIQEISAVIKRSFLDNQTLQDAYGFDPTKEFDEQFSVVSLESIIIYIVSSSIWILEQFWDAFKADVEQSIDNAYVTSIPWYFKKALEFQAGDELVFDQKTYSYKYLGVDPEKQIVKNVAIRQVTDENVTKLKVYFSDENKEPITGDLRTSFESYMREVGAAGTHYLFVSESPDPLRVHLHIYYDPLVLDSSGERLSGSGKPVEETIKNYLDNIEYGGVFYASKLTDMIQKTEGVKDITLDATTWDGSEENRRRIDAISGAFEYVITDGDIIYQID